ncbi:MAG: FIST C-terminal domain-containing protein [Rhodocyclaceae bacterium]|nr:FIST C-terminal domain-containing protein [Rhodocyclaceae bacterium]
MAMVVVDELTPQRVGAVLAAWRGEGERFHLLALLPEAEKAKVGELQAVCREAGVALGGALFPQLIHDGALWNGGALLLRVTAAPPPLLLENVAAADAVERICDQAVGYVENNVADAGEAALFCIFDALVPNIATHLDSWYLRLADRVRYFGVNAGNERFVSEPCVFDNERFVADAVLLQLLPAHPGACLEHGYAVPAQAITATSATGNSIVQIDWRPALEVYRDIMQAAYGVAIDRDNFYSHAVHFPFGILRADGEVLVRIPVALGDKGEIVCVGEIQPNSMLTLLDARAGSGKAAAALARDLAQQGAAGGGDLLLFYCAGRRLHIGAGLGDELAAVARETAAPQVAGALSLGEIGGARSDGYPLFHNATLVGVPWPQR